MVRLIVRELSLAVLCLALASTLAFVLLDRLGPHDWYGTAAQARRAGLPIEHALGRNVPLLWNPHVADAQVHTQRDLRDLARPALRPMARERLVRRGTAALPDLLEGLGRLGPAARHEALRVLADWAPTLTGGTRAPEDEAEALAWWGRFQDVHGLDFRPGYIRRLAERIAAGPNHNAQEQLVRLGTYGLPWTVRVLLRTREREGRIRLVGLLADVLGTGQRVAPGAGEVEVRQAVESWRSLWSAEHLEFERLTEWQRVLGHVTETRLGTWMEQGVQGRLGVCVVTRRPVAMELRERLPVSLLIAGLGGLLAVALVVASIARNGRWRLRLLDLAGALVPGLGALTVLFVVVLELCATPGPAGPLLRAVFAPWVRLLLAVVLDAGIAVLWLRRASKRAVLERVRERAESLAVASLSGQRRRVLPRAVRLGLASLLAPMGLAASGVALAALVVEPLLGLHGLGALTWSALWRLDAPWLMVSVLIGTLVVLARRWSRRVLHWALGADEEAVEEPAPS